MVPFGDGPPSGPTVYHQDRVGGRLLRVEDGHRQMADVPWVPVAGHLEFGGNRALWAIDRFELGSVDGRGFAPQVVARRAARATMAPITAPGRCIVCTVPTVGSVGGALPARFKVGQG